MGAEPPSPAARGGGAPLAGLSRQFGALEPLAWSLQAATSAHFALLIRARLRSPACRALVSLPGHSWMAGAPLAFP